jgi:4a-hydroxytetrahydrobiopterin dehydratase
VWAGNLWKTTDRPLSAVGASPEGRLLAGFGGERNEEPMSVEVPDGWAEVDGALEREFTFDTFPIAIAFVNAVARIAQRENHHPDIRISYRTVTLRWVTHSAGAITDRDRELAEMTAKVAG